MNGPVSESEMVGILVHAKLAAKNVRAQRDRLVQFQLQLQQPPLTSPTVEEADDAAAAVIKEIASGLINVCFSGIEMGARSLATCFELAFKNGAAPSLPLEFGEISDEELFDCLLTLRLPRRPVTQFQAFARVETAYYAVKCSQEHFLPHCIEHLGYPYYAYVGSDDDEDSLDGGEIGLPDTDDEDSQEGGEIGLPDTDDEDSKDGGEIGLPDPVTGAATEHLAKTGLLDPVAVVTEDLAKIGLADSDAAATENLGKISLPDQDAAATTEPTKDSGMISGLPAPAASATGESTQATSIDLDKARTYLKRACTLANLAVKSIDLAVTTISSFADQKEVAAISNFVDRFNST